MKKAKIVLLFISLFIVLNLLFACGGNKSVKLTMENYEDYLNVNVGELDSRLYINVSSRNSDYIFENCEIEVIPLLFGYESDGDTYDSRKGLQDFYEKGKIIVKVERNGNANYKSGSYFNSTVIASDGKKYWSQGIGSYNILSVKGKVTKNQLS